MEEWKSYRLGELYEVHNGLSKSAQYFGSGFPFLSFSTVFKNYFLPEQLDSLVESNDREQLSFSINRGDVFITRTSETAEELGMSSVALKAYPGATYNGLTKRLRPIHGEHLVHPEFIGYYLRSPQFRNHFYALTSSMSTRASLANGDLLAMEVMLPSISEQKRISGILLSLDSKIALNNGINHNLEEQAQALYKSWFEDNSECENWPKTTLSAFFNVLTGKKDANFSSPDGPYPFFTCSQAPLRAPSYSFEGKAILMAGNGDFNVKRYIGKFEAYQRTYVLMPFEDKYQSFLYLLMSLHLGDITGGSRGSVIKFITKGSIADYSFRFPPYCIDDKLAVLNSIYAKVDEHNAEIEHLSTLRDQLLPKLIGGDYC